MAMGGFYIQETYVTFLFIIPLIFHELQAKMSYTTQGALFQEIIGNHW